MPSLTTWNNINTLTNFFPQNLQAACVVTYDNYIYVIGGMSDNWTNYWTKFQYFGLNTVYGVAINNDGTLGTWKTICSSINNPLPGKLYDACAVVFNKYIYVLTGFNCDTNKAHNIVYSAEILSPGKLGKWMNINSIKISNIDVELTQARAIIANNHISIFSGIPNYDPKKLFQMILTARINNSMLIEPWKYVGLITQPNTLAVNGCAVTINNFVYYIGGSLNIDFVNSTDKVFYAKLNSNGTYSTLVWKNTTPLPKPIANACAVVSDNYIYIMGGSENNIVYSTSVNPDGTLNSWIDMSTPTGNFLPNYLENACAISSNNYIYIIGGIIRSFGQNIQSAQFQNSVYSTKIS